MILSLEIKSNDDALSATDPAGLPTEAAVAAVEVDLGPDDEVCPAVCVHISHGRGHRRCRRRGGAARRLCPDGPSFEGSRCHSGVPYYGSGYVRSHPRQSWGSSGKFCEPGCGSSE